MSEQEQNAEKKYLKFFNTKRLVLTALSIALIFVIIVFILIICNNIKANSSNLSTISTSSLQKVLEINELSTVNYTYNAVATKKDNKGNDAYYVAYEGIITAGIDFNKIKTEIIKDEKKVIITIPQIEIQDQKVSMETLEFIFLKSEYETEDVTVEAYELCKENLKESINNDNVLFEVARENAINSVEALFKPWIEKLDSSFILEIQCEE